MTKLLKRLKNLKNFKFGAKHLSPIQRLGVHKTTLFWGNIGLTMADISMVVSLIYTWNWKTFGFTVFVTCMIVMQHIQYVNTKEQIESMKNLENLQSQMGGEF